MSRLLAVYEAIKTRAAYLLSTALSQQCNSNAPQGAIGVVISVCDAWFVMRIPHRFLGGAHLYFSCIAYTLLNRLRREGLKTTEMQQSQRHPIRKRLLKIGGLTKVSVHRIYGSMAESFPFLRIFEQVYQNFQNLQPAPS